jgi:UDP-glucose 4-epimerase
MKVLVTGGAGFIGSHLVESLVLKGAEVIVFDNFSTGNINNLQRIISKIRVIENDVRNADSLMSAMKGVNSVFHLAAQTSVLGSLVNPLLTHEINNSGTLNVLWAALKMNISKIVISSSCSVYGDIHLPPLKESDSPSPKSPYAASKLFAEALADSFYYSYGLETVCLRYFNVYGERQSATSDYAAVIPRFIDCYRQRQSPIIYGDGQQSRDFIHVSDVVKANWLAASTSSEILTQYRTFNIGSGQNVTITELLDIISAEAGYILPPDFQSSRIGDIRVSRADITLARQYLDFSPAVDLKDGIKNLYNYESMSLPDL